MIGRAWAGPVPMKSALALFDRHVIDAGVADGHQPILIELPVLIAVGAEPLTGIVMPFIGEADGDPISPESPDFLDQAIIAFPRPFPFQERDDLRPPHREFCPVAPTANGLAFSPDGRTMYHSDSRGPWVDGWDLDTATGAISNRRRVKTLTNEEGRPDGGACDMEGNYWSSGISAHVLNKFTPNGEMLLRIAVPALLPTMPCFGGPDMKTIFITSSRENLSAEKLAQHPDSGALFAVDVDVAGVPVGLFRDR